MSKFDVTTTTREILKHAIAVGEGSSRLSVLAKGPLVSLFICFSLTRGGVPKT